MEKVKIGYKAFSLYGATDTIGYKFFSQGYIKLRGRKNFIKVKKGKTIKRNKSLGSFTILPSIESCIDFKSEWRSVSLVFAKVEYIEDNNKSLFVKGMIYYTNGYDGRPDIINETGDIDRLIASGTMPPETIFAKQFKIIEEIEI